MASWWRVSPCVDLGVCFTGGQWDKANEVLEQMTSQSCMPDVVTYTALISAYERGGRWQSALQVFHKMCVQGCKPDAIVYNGEQGVTKCEESEMGRLSGFRIDVFAGQSGVCAAGGEFRIDVGDYCATDRFHA